MRGTCKLDSAAGVITLPRALRFDSPVGHVNPMTRIIFPKGIAGLG
jgi:hypothetical protein